MRPLTERVAAMPWPQRTKIASAICIILCASCAHPAVKDHGAEPTPGKSVGRPGCGPPIPYQVFRRDAFGADWSKTKNLLAYNAKGADGAYHVYTVKPDGADAVQLGAGSPGFPQRGTGTPVWSPSGVFIAFVAEKSNHPGSSVSATPGWGSYSDLWVANADGSRPGWHAGAVQRADRVTDRRRLQRNRRLLGRLIVAGGPQRLRNPQLLEQPDLSLRPEFPCD